MEVSIFLKIFLAAVLGGVIGLEREIARKGDGLRSSILIAVGSALFTVLSFKLAGDFKGVSPSSLVAPVILGIGILGAATIIRERFASRGLAGAAIIWLVAGVGVAVGSGYYLTAFVVAIMVLLILFGLRRFAVLLETHSQLYAYVLSTEDRASVLIEVKKVIRELGLKYTDARLRKVDDGYEIEIAMHTSATKNQSFLEKAMQLPGVKEISSEYL